MTSDPMETLPDEVSLALAYSPADKRDALRIFFELDSRLSRIVSATSEPMLGQMRLAWWRDQLGAAPHDRPSGDAVLDGVGAYWNGKESALVALVDGWEYMLSEVLDTSAALGFARGRASAFGAIAPDNRPDEVREALISQAQRWALVDAAVHIPDGEERETLLNLAREIDTTARFPKELRGLCVLDALSVRSLARGGRPLMEGRGAALVAIRAAIFGR